MNLKNLDVAHVTARLGRFIAAIAIVGSALAGLLGGWTWAAGFLIGAVASYFNFRNLAGIAQSLGTPASSGRAGALAWLLFRLILLVTGAFVIIKLTKINVYCTCAGLFTPVVAVVLEAILALTYAS